MSNMNPECCGGHCTQATGEVRVYPLGGGANLILCQACWGYENTYRRGRGDEGNWPVQNWYAAEVYGGASDV